MQYAIAGWPVAGCPSESLLERITRKLQTDGNALSTYLISQESQRMDQTLMAIQTKFTIATFIGDEKMFREAVDAYKKWILILKLRSSKSIH
ncbi:lambda Kil [Escherichia coli O157:H7 str. G5101]|nr:lambda Kil [Escherichia coli O157:H7 str. G5101]